jgi:hypothetical protein
MLAAPPYNSFPTSNSCGKIILRCLIRMNDTIPVKNLVITRPREPGSRYARNVEIFGDGEPADYLYEAVSGLVRYCKALDDRCRQVTGFHMAGEVRRGTFGS